MPTDLVMSMREAQMCPASENNLVHTVVPAFYPLGFSIGQGNKSPRRSTDHNRDPGRGTHRAVHQALHACGDALRASEAGVKFVVHHLEVAMEPAVAAGNWRGPSLWSGALRTRWG